MNLIINSETISFEKDLTIDEVLNRLQIKDKVMAVAVNMEIVKKEFWDSFVPKENDKIELLQFVGGG
ncbi:MAG: sulfur carrier protein ThiS [Arcobacter butzleri]|jgi:sulfur carrier protein|nr:sulfur carrier protein ThiS [Arcobacteraceae bacterium]MDY0365879.1 sulfur carrier protein ThiS [Arcobacteraceae bacterium]NLO17686.1 sulfur carrier protein ThiS [Aliarcobacter butzleri]